MPVVIRAERSGDVGVDVEHRLREQPPLRLALVVCPLGKLGEHRGVHLCHLIAGHVRHVRYARDGGEAGGDRVPAHGRRGIHAADDLDVEQPDELLALVVEPPVGEQLLQKRDELDRVVLVGFREVDVLQVQHQALGITRSEHPMSDAAGGDGLAATLRQFLNNVRRGGLRGARQRRHGRPTKPSEAVLEDHRLTAPLGADEHERLAGIEPRDDEGLRLRNRVDHDDAAPFSIDDSRRRRVVAIHGCGADVQ